MLICCFSFPPRFFNHYEYLRQSFFSTRFHYVSVQYEQAFRLQSLSDEFLAGLKIFYKLFKIMSAVPYQFEPLKKNSKHGKG